MGQQGRLTKTKPAGTGSTQDDTANSLRWWDSRYSSNRDRAGACERWLSRVLQRQDLRRRVHLFNAQMYEDIPTLGLGPYQYSVYDLGTERLRLNVVRTVTNTYGSLITSSKPKARVLTDDGTWELKKKAKGLQRWLDGNADECDLYSEVSNPCCLDSGVFGAGIAKVYRTWPNRKELWDVGVERVFPWEICVDDAEAQNPRRLRTMAQRKWYDRLVAVEMFPDSRAELLRAGRTSNSSVFDWAIDSAADLIAINEFWRLPTYPGARDGLHVIALEGHVLLEEAWERQTFPFAFLYRDRPTMGFWGVSIPHELRGAQVHINQSLFDFEEGLRNVAKPKWMFPVGSVDPNFLDDDMDTAIPYTPTGGMKPEVMSPGQAFPPESYSFTWAIWQKAFEQIGISQEQGQGKIDPGVSGSGASIRAASSVRDGRMFRASENFQDWHMRIADLRIEEARAIAKDKPDFASGYRAKKYVEIVYFRKVDPGKDRYWLKVFPESRLSKDPAERLAQLEEWRNGGVISNAEYRELLDFPDLDAENNLVNAPRELAEELITRFLEADNPNAPDVMIYPEGDWPLEGPDGIMVRMQYAKLRAQLDKAPPANVLLFVQFLSLCDAVLAKKQAPGMTQTPGGVALPPGAAAPPQLQPALAPPKAA